MTMRTDGMHRWAAIAAALAVLVPPILGGLQGISTAAEDTGAETIVLEGGASGPVPFPHRTHQAVLKDCMTCHQSFPQEAGSIERLKAAGTLKKKQVMNKQCTACHKAMAREGKPSGPTTCKSCHSGAG